MFEFLRLGLKPTVRVQRERARQPREFFIAKQMPAFKSLLKASCTYSKGGTSVCEKKY